MLKKDFYWLVGCAVLGAASMRIAAAQAPPAPAAPAPPLPVFAPSLVPALFVDLMTAEGMASFRAQWKTMEAKIVEGPALPNAMPAFKTSYDINPHAGESGFDDSSWPTIDPKDLAALLFRWLIVAIDAQDRVASATLFGEHLQRRGIVTRRDHAV